MRLHKPIGIYLLLWPTLWALWIAGAGRPAPEIGVVFVLGVILMRSAGCVINDYADRHIDPYVARTQDRPLAAARVTPRAALWLFVTLCLLAFALVLTTNAYTVALSVVAVLLAAIYPFMKRYTHWPQVVLGAAFAWAVPMSFAAQTGAIAPVAWLLFAATVLWTVAYDTMYAMVDRPDDIRIGVKSTAILFGRADRLIIGLLQCSVLALLIIVGALLSRGVAYGVGILIAAGLAIYQQALLRERDGAQCFRAFTNNHWFGMAIFGGILVDYWLRGAP